jgi:hypothetical protein
MTRHNSWAFDYKRKYHAVDLDYSDELEFDFGGFPQYIVKEIIKLFNFDYEIDGEEPGNDEIEPPINYDVWTENLKKWLPTLWEDIRLNVLRKGIDYCQDCLEFHRESCGYCSEWQDCKATLIWKIRIVNATGVINEMVPGVGNPIRNKFLFSDNVRFANQSIKNKLTYVEIALLFYYQGVTVTKQNCESIAKSHKYKSGEKLYQCYNKYSNRFNRIGSEDSKKKNSNKIALIEKVITNLQDKDRKQAIDDLATLKANILKD